MRPPAAIAALLVGASVTAAAIESHSKAVVPMAVASHQAPCSSPGHDIDPSKTAVLLAQESLAPAAPDFSVDGRRSASGTEGSSGLTEGTADSSGSAESATAQQTSSTRDSGAESQPSTVDQIARPQVTNVYTPSLPAGFVQIVRTVRTIRQGDRLIQTTTITRYRRAYRPLPPSWIEIPFLGLRKRLVEGVSQRAMARGPGHFPGMALPGEVGNCAIAAHSNVPGCDYFRSLHRLRRGDSIYLHSGGQEYEYQVVNLHVVRPTDVYDLRPTTYRRLTLVTCTLPGGRNRLIVVAVGPDNAPPPGEPVLEASRPALPRAGAARPPSPWRGSHRLHGSPRR